MLISSFEILSIHSVFDALLQLLHSLLDLINFPLQLLLGNSNLRDLCLLNHFRFLFLLLHRLLWLNAAELHYRHIPADVLLSRVVWRLQVLL